MLKIYVCEDNPRLLEAYFQLAKKAILLKDWNIQMGAAASGPGELLSSLPDGEDGGLYFLDIELGAGQNGFELAREIRRKDPKAFLVFLTSHSEWALETFRYRLEAMDFIVKTEDEEALRQRMYACIQSAYERFQAWNVDRDALLNLKSGEKELFLPCSQVLYITSSEIPHHIVLHTLDSLYDVIGSLKEIQTKHPSIWIFCHRSLLVNRNHIREKNLLRRTLLLDNGELLPCSIRSFKEL